MTIDDLQQMTPFPRVDVTAPPSRTTKPQLVNMLIEARFALVEAQNRHMHDTLTISRRLIAEARSRQWCSDYDEIVSDLNDQLTIKLTDRSVQARLEREAEMAEREQRQAEQQERYAAEQAERREQQRLWDEAVAAETAARLEAQGFPPPEVPVLTEADVMAARERQCASCANDRHATETGTHCTCCGMVRVDGQWVMPQ